MFTFDCRFRLLPGRASDDTDSELLEFYLRSAPGRLVLQSLRFVVCTPGLPPPLLPPHVTQLVTVGSSAFVRRRRRLCTRSQLALRCSWRSLGPSAWLAKHAVLTPEIVTDSSSHWHLHNFRWLSQLDSLDSDNSLHSGAQSL